MALKNCFQSLSTFPALRDCPDDCDDDMDYYIAQGGWLRPRQHWCLLAQITHATVIFRLRLWARDRTGEEFPIAFYVDDVDPDPQKYKVGHTVAILYPHTHAFLAGSFGIRQEQLDTIMVIPAGLNEILSLGETLSGWGTSQAKRCQVCSSEEQQAMTCGRCRSRWYCSKECQKADWEGNGHKQERKAIKLIIPFLRVDWQHWQDYRRFPLDTQ